MVEALCAPAVRCQGSSLLASLAAHALGCVPSVFESVIGEGCWFFLLCFLLEFGTLE